jgi:hypothetical protein
MVGVLVRKKNNLRVVLTLELIMKSVSVEIDEQDLETVGPDLLPWDGRSCSGSSEFSHPIHRKREAFDDHLN